MSRVACALGLGLGMAGLYWVTLSGPFPLAEFCTRRHPTWVLPLFERPRYTAVAGERFILVVAAASLTYLGALWLARGVRGGRAALLLLGLVPLGLLLVLAPGYPLLSGDVFKYVFDGRILAQYGQNPFLHVPAEFPEDRFYDLVYWKAVVNAHGPLWRLAEAGSAWVGGESCIASVLAMKVWPGLAYLGTIGALFVTLRAWRPDRAVWGTIIYAWNPLVVLEAVQNGHNDVVAALPALWAVWLAQRGRFDWAFPLLAVAALVKPLALALGPLLLVSGLRPAESVRRGVVGGLGLAAALFILAWLPFWEGSATLQGMAREQLFSGSPAKLFLTGLEWGGLGLDRAMGVTTGLSMGLFLILLASLLLAVWRGRLSLTAAALGVFFLYLLVAAQWFNPWYLLWLAPFAALVDEGPPRTLGIGFTLLALLVYPFQDEALPIVLAVFAPMTLLALRWRRWLGWPGPGPRSEAAGAPRWQVAGGS